MRAGPAHPEALLIKNDVKVCHKIRPDHVLRVTIDSHAMNVVVGEKKILLGRDARLKTSRQLKLYWGIGCDLLVSLLCKHSARLDVKLPAPNGGSDVLRVCPMWIPGRVCRARVLGGTARGVKRAFHFPERARAHKRKCRAAVHDGTPADLHGFSSNGYCGNINGVEQATAVIRGPLHGLGMVVGVVCEYCAQDGSMCEKGAYPRAGCGGQAAEYSVVSVRTRVIYIADAKKQNNLKKITQTYTRPR